MQIDFDHGQVLVIIIGAIAEAVVVAECFYHMGIAQGKTDKEEENQQKLINGDVG